jgi:hypothetical protein
MTQNVICILASQRSGTTALQDAIASNGSIKSYGEIFQMLPGEVGERRRLFWSFVRERGTAYVDAVSPKGAAQLAKGYLDWLRGPAFL